MGQRGSATLRVLGIHRRLTVLLAVLFLPAIALTQQPCTTGIRIEATISDPTGAFVAGAQIVSADGRQSTTDGSGRFVLPCVLSASASITVRAEGFAPITAQARAPLGGTAHLNLRLAIASVQTDVQVSADASGVDTDSGTDTTTLNSADVQRLPDDPDDFLRLLQQIAAASGGDPNAASIKVDGFQNGSALPPKSSIGSIRVNPDLFSSQYEWPPWGGGVIEITTKPGAPTYHGALFFTGSNAIFNATDPFSVSPTPASKQRFGFELSGPIYRQKSGFSLDVEKRDINEFNVVNATTLDASKTPASFQQSVSAPQRLWIASARGDWQVTPKDTATLSFSANVNNLSNQGVGGLVLPDAGYASVVSEYDLRLSNVMTVNPNLLHETRIGYSWKRTQQTPVSPAPAVQVAGFFTGGGATSQNLNNRERDLEIDDEVMAIHGKHTVKLGAQSIGYFIRNYDPDTFNGAYVFGGGSAPALDSNDNPTEQTTTITGLEQYRRAVLNLPGGTPTTYQLTTGTPLVPFTQWRVGFFVNDTFKLLPNLTIDGGLRYEFETTPGSYANFAPRLGVAWSLDKKATWVIHLRGGFFPRSANNLSDISQVYRLRGDRQRSVEVYSPNFGDPLTPAPGSIQVGTVNQFAGSFGQMNTFIAYLNIEHEFPQHWHARLNLFSGQDWDSLRILNINAPMVPSSVGVAPDPTAALLAPRPIAPNQNIFQYQNSGHLLGNLISFNLDQHGYKRLGLSFRYAHMNFKSNVVDSGINSPQSTYRESGESGRVEWSKNNYCSLSGNLILPYRVELATQFDAGDGRRYNVTTGTDNNGDGNFNDRPSYAVVPSPGVFVTRFGLLTTNTVNGNLPRDLGTMPGPIHLDVNLSRAFSLNPKDKEHLRTITLNARSANLLNHTNVTAVNSVLSSSAVGQPIAAEAARRIEFGIRFAF